MNMAKRLTNIHMMEVRTLSDWTIRPRIKSIGGIASVIVIGGDCKQYQVLANPEKLKHYDVSLGELLAVIAILVIFLLLYFEFKNVKLSFIVLINLPLALIGGILIVYFTSGIISIAATIGFISLFGNCYPKRDFAGVALSGFNEKGFARF